MVGQHRWYQLTLSQVVTALIAAVVAGAPFVAMIHLLLPFLGKETLETSLSIVGLACFGASAVVVAFDFGCAISGPPKEMQRN